MKFLAVFISILFIPSIAIAQVDRSGGKKVSDLGNIATSNIQEAKKICRRKGGNLVIKYSNRYSCHYSQNLKK
jgi:hypothetical protein